MKGLNTYNLQIEEELHPGRDMFYTKFSLQVSMQKVIILEL